MLWKIKLRLIHIKLWPEEQWQKKAVYITADENQPQQQAIYSFYYNSLILLIIKKVSKRSSKHGC